MPPAVHYHVEEWDYVTRTWRKLQQVATAPDVPVNEVPVVRSHLKTRLIVCSCEQPT